MHALPSLAAGLLLGITLRAFGLDPGFSPWMGVLVLGLGTLLMVVARGRPERPSRAGAALLSLLALATGLGVPPAEPSLTTIRPGTYRVVGEVVERRGRSATLEVREGEALELEGEALPPGARLRLGGLSLEGSPAPIGSRLRLLARLRPAPGFFNPSPEASWPRGERPDASGRALSAPTLIRPAPWTSRLLEAARGRLRRALASTLPPSVAALSRALVLGEREALAEGERESLREAGLAHVLAVSGLHVSLLAGLLVALGLALLRRAPRLAERYPLPRLAALFGIPAALAYAALAGGPPSAERAALTLTIGLGLLAAGRRPRPLAVCAAAAILLALLAPEEASSPAFLLSVASTAAILGGLTEPGAGPLRLALGATLRATVATAPIVLLCFGRLPLLGLLSNLLLVPLLSAAILPLALIHALLAAALPPLAALTAPPLTLLSRAFLAGASALSELGAVLVLPPLDRAEALIAAAASAALLLARGWRARLAAVVLSALALGGAELHLRHRERPRGELRLGLLDVGQGDAAWIDLPDGRLLLLDAGGALFGRGPDPGEEVLLPLLRARRRGRIDVLAISHPHPDHCGGALALIAAAERGELEIGEIWDTEQGPIEEPEGAWALALARARALGVRIVGPAALCARPRRFGRASLRTLHPCPRYDPGFGPNESSFVFDLRFGRRRFLFAGDAEAHAEETLLRGGLRGPVTLLKVGHHGSRTSSAEPFLRALSPRWATISAGRGNLFGHPHPEVLARLRRHARHLHRSDRQGGLILRTDGRDLRVEARGR